MIETFEQFSQLSLFTALFVYTIAFVLYAIDLANRSGGSDAVASGAAAAEPALADAAAAGNEGATGASASRSSAATAAGGAGGPVAVATRPAASGRPGSSAAAGAPGPRRSKVLRVAFSLTVLGWLFQVACTVLRGMEAGRVPFTNMYEFALTATTVIVGVFIVVQFFVDIRFLGSLITGLTVVFLGLTRVNYYREVVPLPPALDSYWLIIHITVAVLAVGFLTLGFGLSAAQIAQSRREARALEGRTSGPRFLATFPGADRLENLAYRVNIIGFIFWSFTLIAGAIWAEHAWGRYWGWDTKEVWTFIIWVLYAGYIHARATRGWRGSRSSWLSIIAYAAVVFNFVVVNVFFKGLHAYSGL